MVIDSRAKGARNELAARDKLREYTGLQWERTPSSGALDAVHQMKGDIYLAGEYNAYCVEVKAYKDEHLNSSIISSKESQLHKWWAQAVRQGKETNKVPLLIFKKDRGKWFIAFPEMPDVIENYIWICKADFYVALLNEWIEGEQPAWTSKT